MPKIDLADEFHEHDQYFEYLHKEFQEIKSEIVVSKLPDWCNEYILESETEDREELKSLSDELTRLNIRIFEQRLIIEKHDELKRILISTGDELEILISKLFRELGYNVV